MADKIIIGQFTNCCTEKVTDKDIIYCLENDYQNKYKVLRLINGVTGYEDITIDSIERILRLSSFGWLACFGTEKVYDKLFITPNELIKMFVNEGIITVNLD